MGFTGTAFNTAVLHIMQYEVGGFFKLTPDVQAGLISTPEQRKAVGYTVDPNDAGGETKFGVSKNANSDLNITALTWEGACAVYYNRYWIKGQCDKLPSRVAVLHFDGCVNHGTGRAAQFLQAVVHVQVDGSIGPATLAAVSAMSEIDICNSICDQRENFYRAIVQNNPSQVKYLNGWLRRVQEMRAFSTSLSDF